MTTATKSITTACKATIPNPRRPGRRADILASPATEDQYNIHQFLVSTDLLADAVYGFDVHRGRALRDWPASVPQFPLALLRVSRILGAVAGELEGVTLEDRALAIARAEEAEQGGAA